MAMKSAIIQKPETLIPENIAEGVDIAGIVGTLAAGGGPDVQYTCNSSGYITSAKFVGYEFLPAKLFYYHFTLSSVDLSESPNLAGIGEFAFNNASSLTSIALPDSVTSIGSSAFSKCKALASFTIPAGLTELSSSIFSGCVALTEITIPQSVKRIGINAFYGCTALASAVFESPNNWKYGNSYGSPKGTISMANPATAAAYLNSTYSVYYLWQD